MDFEQMAAVVGEITYKPGYELRLERDKRAVDPPGVTTQSADTRAFVPAGRPYLQARFWRPDSVTGEPGWGYSGKSYVSPAMTLTEFLNAAFGVFIRLEEHECREAFRWKGRAINGPHVSAEARWEIAGRVDVRKPIEEAELDARIDALHGPGAAAALDEAIASGHFGDVPPSIPALKRLPAEWARERGLVIVDPDGWRGDSPRFLGPRDPREPCTKAEFDSRIGACTVAPVDSPAGRARREDGCEECGQPFEPVGPCDTRCTRCRRAADEPVVSHPAVLVELSRTDQ